MTVSRRTPADRAVFRVPILSATWLSTVTTFGADNRPVQQGSIRSENRARHVEQRSRRGPFSTYRAGIVRLPKPGHSGFKQQEQDRLRPSTNDLNKHI